MRRLLGFTTTLDRDSVLRTLKENTYPTENDFLTLFFDKHYFTGQVNERKIRIKNAGRNPKNPSPILDITIDQRDGLTEVIIHDDTADDITTNKLMIQTVTISIAIAVLLVGGILSLVQPKNYSFLWTLGISFVVAGFGFINAYYYKETVKLNTFRDLEFLLRLLKR